MIGYRKIHQPQGGVDIIAKKKALIHIGGGYMQLSTIEWAKDLGLHVVVTDKNHNAPGRSHADQFEIINGNNVSDLLELADRVSTEHELIGAYSSSDFGLTAVASINDKFRSPGCSRNGVKYALDKSIAKSIWEVIGLPTPKGMIVHNFGELFLAIRELGIPAILKPVDSSGSQGVQSVWHETELESAYNLARQFSPDVLVEQIVEGYHIDVNGLFINNKFLPCGTMDRFFCNPPYHYPVWGCQPSILDNSQEEEVYTIVEKCARALDINIGPVKADVIWTKKGPVILEIAPRFHGDVSTVHVTPLATENNPVKAWFAYLCGLDPYDYLREGVVQFAGWMGLFPSIDGEIASVDIENAVSISGVKNIYVSIKPGTILKGHKDNSTVCGFIWATAGNRVSLLEILSIASEAINYSLN